MNEMFSTKIIITDEALVSYDTLSALLTEEKVKEVLGNTRDTVFDLCKDIFSATEDRIYVTVGQIGNELITTIIINDTYDAKMKEVFESENEAILKLTIDAAKAVIKMRVQSTLSETDKIDVSFLMPNGEVL